MKGLLGIDIGTSALKAALFTPQGRPVDWVSIDYCVSTPHPGWAEQDPKLWWDAACQALRLLWDKGHAPKDILAVGVDGASWAMAAIGDNGTALCPSPLWMDTRAQAICEAYEEAFEKEGLFTVSKNPLKPGYTLPKILWLKKTYPEVYARTRFFLQSNGFLVYRMTGAVTQDTSQGYGYACYDMEKHRWDEHAVRFFGLAREKLPDILPSTCLAGTVTAQAAQETGLLTGTPVAAGGLDAACAALGVGVVSLGQAQEQGGQAGGMSLVTSRAAGDPRLILGAHVVPGKYLLQGGTTGGGGVLRWCRDLWRDLSYAQMDAEAKVIPPGSDGVVFLPYLSGERSPLWDPRARGIFYGLDYRISRGHMLRAAMEGAAFALRHNLETAQGCGVSVSALRATGGAANSALWTQIKADVTGKTLEVPASDTATAWGAAILGGVATGVFTSCEKAVSGVDVLRACVPREEFQEVYERNYRIYKELSRQTQAIGIQFAGEAR